MNRSEALKIDKEFYIDFDESVNSFCVFGDNSGFCYYVGVNEKDCEKWMNNFLARLI